MDTIEFSGVRHDISRQEVSIDGKRYLEICYEVDHGPKLGTTKVRVLDPCITEEAQERRRQAIIRTCKELMAKGHISFLHIDGVLPQKLSVYNFQDKIEKFESQCLIRKVL